MVNSFLYKMGIQRNRCPLGHIGAIWTYCIYITFLDESSTDGWGVNFAAADNDQHHHPEISTQFLLSPHTQVNSYGRQWEFSLCKAWRIILIALIKTTSIIQWLQLSVQPQWSRYKVLINFRGNCASNFPLLPFFKKSVLFHFGLKCWCHGHKQATVEWPLTHPCQP